MANEGTSSSRRRWVLPVVIAVVVALGAVAGGIWWFLRDDAPPEVSLDAAVSAAGDGPEATTAPADGTDGSAAPTADGVDGSWTVRQSSGDVAFDDSETGSFAGVRISEELRTIGSTTAVARTPDVTGGITIDGTTLTEASFEVDLTTITTNDSRRDDKVQSALETSQFPTATFELSDPVPLGEAAASGDPVAVDAPGQLTIHGVTRDVTVPIEAQLVDGRIALVGSLEIAFGDWDVQVPSSPVVLSVDDVGTLEVQLVLDRT